MQVLVRRVRLPGTLILQRTQQLRRPWQTQKRIEQRIS